MKHKPLMVKMSDAFKEHIALYADANGMDMSTWARGVLAKASGYNLGEDDALDGRGRPKKYESEVERKKARSKAARTRRATGKAVVEEVMRQNRLRDREELATWLESRGITLDDEAPTAAR